MKRNGTVIAIWLWKFSRSLHLKMLVTIRASALTARQPFRNGEFYFLCGLYNLNLIIFIFKILISGSTIVHNATIVSPLVSLLAGLCWIQLLCGVVVCASTVHLNTTSSIGFPALCVIVISLTNHASLVIL